MDELPVGDLAAVQSDPRKKRRPLVRAIQVLVSMAIVVAVFVYAIPKFADYSKVWAAIDDMSAGQLLVLVGVTVLNIVTYWPQMVAAMPGLTLGQAAVNNQSSTTVANTVPGGGFIANGIAYSMYRSWGFTNSEIGLSLLLSAIWNSFVKLSFPIIAVVILVFMGSRTATLLIPALIGLVTLVAVVLLFALALSRKLFARSIGRGLGSAATAVRQLFRKGPVQDWDEAAIRFRQETIRVVSKRWPALTTSTVVSHVILFSVLLLSLRFAGVTGSEVSWAQVFGVFAFGRLLTALPLTPGGLGVVELAYIAGLVLAGRGHTTVLLPEFKAQVAAGVLMFRALTYGAQIPLGAITYVIWRRKKSWRKPVPARELEPVAAGVPL
ncbi:MAG: YbhN family protein [Actinomycetota bacterium]|nr:YbhN family protein [Actinomycetota bacterium]